MVALRGSRILVVDDTSDNRQIIRDLLVHAGFEVLEAENGERGLAIAGAERPDLVIMDVGLPGLNGYDVNRLLKSDPRLKATPVIAVSSYVLSGDDERSRAAECHGFVSKPVSPAHLLRIVRSLLGSRGRN